jgi:hypothetical protein
MSESLRAKLLREAERLTTGDRNNSYGPPHQDFTRTAGAASALGFSHDGKPLQAHHVAMFIAVVKLSRLTWAPGKEDSWVDLAGYAACGHEAYQLSEKEKFRTNYPDRQSFFQAYMEQYHSILDRYRKGLIGRGQFWLESKQLSDLYREPPEREEPDGSSQKDGNTSSEDDPQASSDEACAQASSQARCCKWGLPHDQHNHVIPETCNQVGRGFQSGGTGSPR